MEPARRAIGKPEGSRVTLTKILLFFAVLQVYNIVALHQDIVDLSTSVKALATWWRFLIGEIFYFLNLDIPALAREIITILLVFTSAANIEFYRKHGELLVTGMFAEAIGRVADAYFIMFHDAMGELDLRKDQPSILGIDMNDTRGTFIGFISFAFVLLAMVLWLADILLPRGFTLYLYSSVLVFIVLGPWTDDAIGTPGFLNNWRILAIFIYYPLVLIALILFPIATYYRGILRISRYLIILLLADLAARFLVDPVLAQIASLPAPPVRP